MKGFPHIRQGCLQVKRQECLQAYPQHKEKGFNEKGSNEKDLNEKDRKTFIRFARDTFAFGNTETEVNHQTAESL